MAQYKYEVAGSGTDLEPTDEAVLDLTPYWDHLKEISKDEKRSFVDQCATFDDMWYLQQNYGGLHKDEDSWYKDATPVCEIELIANSFATNLRHKWSILRSTLMKHEKELYNRWMRRSFKDRKAILQQAWPDIPSMHRPDVYTLQHQLDKELTAPTFRDFFLLPHLNIEDLAKKQDLSITPERSRSP